MRSAATLAAALLLLSASAGSVAFASDLAEAPLIGFEKAHRPNEFIVRFKDDAGISRAVFRKAGVEAKHVFESSPAVAVSVPEGADVASALQTLREDPNVAYVQANHIYKIFKDPNDPSFSSQYHHKNIESAKAWNVSTGSKDVIVAIIDSGVNYNHPDIAPNYWKNQGETGVDANGNNKESNGIDDDGNGYVDDFRGWDFVNDDNDPMDDHGHGTHCAGIIGAKGNNGVGVTGINWDVSLVGLKFINGKTGEGDTIGAVKAIEYATKMGIPITSNSWGGEVEESPSAEGQDEDAILHDAIAAAAAKGYLFVAASGNSRGNNDANPVLPASYELDNILSVAATNSWDWFATYSNYGAKTVDIGAPGSGIYSTVLGSRFASMTGTSMAAPVVAGAAALVKAAHPDWDAVAIKKRLMETADPLSGLKDKVVSGGRLNVGRALAE